MSESATAGVNAIGKGRLIEVQSGSRREAHNTADSRRSVREELPLLEIPRLNLDGKHIKSGEEARAILSLTERLLKKNNDELAPLESFPKNPQRTRLLSQKQSLESRLEKAERFLAKWEKLDNDENLKILVEANNPLAKQAAEILRLRQDLERGSRNKEQTERLEILSESIRDALVQQRTKPV